MSKDFENLPQTLSYIAWNLKRIAEEFERYNDAQQNSKTPVSTQEENTSNSKLREFLKGLGDE